MVPGFPAPKLSRSRLSSARDRSAVSFSRFSSDIAARILRSSKLPAPGPEKACCVSAVFSFSSASLSCRACSSIGSSSFAASSSIASRRSSFIARIAVFRSWLSCRDVSSSCCSTLLWFALIVTSVEFASSKRFCSIATRSHAFFISCCSFATSAFSFPRSASSSRVR